MMNKIVFAAGMAAGFVLGTRAGRESYEVLKARAESLWNSPRVQESVSGATGVLKEKLPAVQEQASGAVKKAQDALSGVLHKDAGHDGAGRSADVTGPSGGKPGVVADPPFENQSDATRPDLTP
ncbi:YtxH domain-containing protein [Arthrobacter sp. MSA 4-2]|uniref:YtxH domain-containing protein n=1 Tax=Arthrobacter sp. MSA 4-2 TaxID=2794349 RepID=UPI0018E75039|nr:YtxH domain-containing protein [Arthrobacter sp. MSA 4-2]MBJ2121835.1 YtxH domain-containing protein [Arthrobacter sp. MSA 4-2]